MAEGFTELFKLLTDDVKKAIKNVFWIVMAFFAIMFAIRVVMALVAYFKGDDERERKEAKQKAINNAIGLIICLISGPVADFLIVLAGGQKLFT